MTQAKNDSEYLLTIDFEDTSMEKLEPLIKHRFWILFGLTLPITLFAYFSASGKMASATAARESELDSTLNGVPTGDSDPNETYAAGASGINQKLQGQFDEQVQLLWESQIDRLTWPKVIVDYIPDEYRGEIGGDACYTYMRVYPKIIENLWKRVQPYVGDPKTNPALIGVEVDWPQKVLIDGHSIPHASFNLDLPAESADIWDAQEDIWLLELIFDAVVRTNEKAAFVSNSPVRQIDLIELVGGSGESTVTAVASAGGLGGYGEEGYGGESYGDYGDEYGGGGGFGGMFGMMAAGAMNAPAQVKFNVAEEFGAPQPAESEEGDTVAAASSYGDYGGGESYGDYGDEYGGMMGMMGMAGFGSGVKMKRYIGDSSLEEGPYRERGFYMSVIVLQDSIPAFLSELSSSPWPIRIGRFHIGPNPYATKGPAGSSPFGGRMASFAGGYGDEGYDEMGGDYGDYGAFGGEFGGMAMGIGIGAGGFGSYGMGGGAAATPLNLPPYMRMPTSIDPGVRGNPGLVQMDFCGIITMYNPQTDDHVEAVGDGSAESDFTEALEESPATPDEAAAMAAEAAADAAANPQAAGADVPAGGAAANAPGTFPAQPTQPSQSPANAAPPASGGAPLGFPEATPNEESPPEESPPAATEAPG